jgi:Predicted integral membrane protein (DUF2282)
MFVPDRTFIFRSFQNEPTCNDRRRSRFPDVFGPGVRPGCGSGKGKCFGIAKAGQNDCANLSGTHSCAGQSKVSDNKDEWKYVAKGTCKDMKGMTMDEAKMMKKS